MVIWCDMMWYDVICDQLFGCDQLNGRTHKLYDGSFEFVAGGDRPTSVPTISRLFWCKMDVLVWNFERNRIWRPLVSQFLSIKYATSLDFFSNLFALFHVFNRWVLGRFCARVKTAASKDAATGKKRLLDKYPSVSKIVSYANIQDSRCTWIWKQLWRRVSEFHNNS